MRCYWGFTNLSQFPLVRVALSIDDRGMVVDERYNVRVADVLLVVQKLNHHPIFLQAR